MLALVSGCSHLGTTSDWSRTYAATHDRVWRTALDTLVDLQFVIEAVDQEAGIIRAESTNAARYRRVMLELKVKDTMAGVRVEVGAGGSVEAPPDMVRLDQVVSDFLLELDEEIRSGNP